MQGCGPMSRMLSGASSRACAAASAAALLEPAAAQLRPLTLLRLLSSATASFNPLVEALPAAAAQPEQYLACERQRRLAAQRQRRRRLSHYAASTSGSGMLAAAAPGPSGGMAWRRSFSSSSSSTAAAPRSGAPTQRTTSAERSFASQPAFDFAAAEEVTTAPAAPGWGTSPAVLRAHAAAASLKIQADARLAEARAAGAALSAPAAFTRGHKSLGSSEVIVHDLVRTAEVEELAPDAPVWQRLARFSAARSESQAALHLYRQEVLNGQDVDAMNHGRHSSLEHVPQVPFLRSGLYAAQQGYGLQSELSRAGLPTRLWSPDGMPAGDAAEVSSRTASALKGLHMAMDASRLEVEEAQALELEEGEPSHLDRMSASVVMAAEARAADAALPPSAAAAAAAAQMQQQQGRPHQLQQMQVQVQATGVASHLNGLPGLSTMLTGQPSQQLGADVEQVAAVHAVREELAEHEEFFVEAYGQGGLLEALDWADRLQHENPGERLAAAEGLKAHKAALQRAIAHTRSKVQSTAPVPAAEQQAVLCALAELLGHPLSEELESAVGRLYSGRCTVNLHAPLSPPRGPEACLQKMEEMAQMLEEELGRDGFEKVVTKHPWVLLMDPQHHGHLQLAALHLVDMSASERAHVVKALPRMLQMDVDKGVLPMLEYLQALGMDTQQLARVLLRDPHYCDPATLPVLKSMVSYWRGKGLPRDKLIHLLLARPKLARTSITDFDLKFDWLEDRLGFTVDDLALSGACFHRPLAVFGPRVAFVQEKLGYKVLLPSQMGESRGPPREIKVTGEMALRTLLHHSQQRFLQRTGTDPAAYEAFRHEWMHTAFPAWLETRRPSMEHYHTFTGPRHPRSPEVAAVHKAQQKQQQQKLAEAAVALAVHQAEAAEARALALSSPKVLGKRGRKSRAEAAPAAAAAVAAAAQQKEQQQPVPRPELHAEPTAKRAGKKARAVAAQEDAGAAAAAAAQQQQEQAQEQEALEERLERRGIQAVERLGDWMRQLMEPGPIVIDLDKYKAAVSFDEELPAEPTAKRAGRKPRAQAAQEDAGASAQQQQAQERQAQMERLDRLGKQADERLHDFIRQLARPGPEERSKRTTKRAGRKPRAAAAQEALEAAAEQQRQQEEAAAAQEQQQQAAAAAAAAAQQVAMSCELHAKRQAELRAELEAELEAELQAEPQVERTSEQPADVAALEQQQGGAQEGEQAQPPKKRRGRPPRAKAAM